MFYTHGGIIELSGSDEKRKTKTRGMAMTTRVKLVDIGGDKIHIVGDGNGWVSPHNGMRHVSAPDAIRAVVEKYLGECGEEAGDEEVDGYVSQMRDATGQEVEAIRAGD
jgi:hypothetical protein